MVKAQIHAGGRGKGKFKEPAAGDKGGVRLAKSAEEVDQYAEQMLGKTLVTAQTGPAGKQVNRLYIEEGAEIEKEFYLSMLVDRANIARRLRRLDRRWDGHREGRARYAREDRDLHGRSGDWDHAASRPRRSPRRSVLRAISPSRAEKLATQLYAAFIAKDMEMLEINPLIVTKDGQLRCLDAKISFDNNALFRHPDIAALARRDGGGREGDRGLQARSFLHHARRHDRLHGQRRRPRHGDDGHHQALWRGAGELPRRRRRRHRRRR